MSGFRHRLWGEDLYFTDIDFCGIEYYSKREFCWSITKTGINRMGYTSMVLGIRH